MSKLSEVELIDWLRGRVAQPSSVAVGIGDDTAVLRASDREWLATVDMLVEGVHFDLARCTPHQVGRKAMGVNLSDIAAMAGQPTHALVAIGIPPGRPESLATELLGGIDAMARSFDVAIVGGDTNGSPSGVVVSVTLLGHPTGRGPVLRSGARPGDVLFVTGRLGYSLAGRHFDFRPRVNEGQLLHARYDLHAMIDVSDGLAADVRHLAEESRCAVVVDERRIPFAEPVISDGRSPLHHALADGEDFELLFGVPPDQAADLEASQPLLGVSVTRVGEFLEPTAVHGTIPTSAPGGVSAGVESGLVFLRDANGTIRPLEARGFVHEW